MDFNTIIQAVGSVGFPIVITIILLWYMKGELSELRKTVENNTLTMQKLLDHLTPVRIHEDDK